MSLWIKAIINHLGWCCTSSIGNEELIREKWLSMLNHIQGIHSWEDNNLFHKCEHRQLDRERKWLKTNSPSFLALKNVVENKKILADIKCLSKFCHHRQSRSISLSTQQILSKKASLYVRGHDSEDTVGSVRL